MKTTTNLNKTNEKQLEIESNNKNTNPQTQIEQQRTTSDQNLAQLNQELTRTQQQLAQLQQQQELAQQQAKAQTPATSAAPSLVHAELTPQTRGVGSAVTLNIPAGTDYAVLQLETENDDYQSYQAELLSPSTDQSLWKSGKLKARTKGNSKIIDLSLRAKLLPPGNYVVKLKGSATSGQMEDIHRYSFKVAP